MDKQGRETMPTVKSWQ